MKSVMNLRICWLLYVKGQDKDILITAIVNYEITKLYFNIYDTRFRKYDLI